MPRNPRITFLTFLVLAGAYLTQLVHRHTQPPRKGVRITKKHYEIKRSIFRPDRSGGEDLGNKFLQLTYDQEADEFLQFSFNATSSFPPRILMALKQVLMTFLKKSLGWNRSDARAFSKLSNLYVASEAQFAAVLQPSITKKPLNILDVGSGMGSETKKIAAVLGVEHENVVTLESSKPLQKVLRSKGFTVGDAIPPQTKFSLVSLLNVLDRTEDPHSLVNSAIDSLAPDGTLLVGIVLPFQDIIEESWGKRSLPEKRLKMRFKKKASFELGACNFLEAILNEHPRLELQNWSRLPYLSSGNMKRTHFVLDMALMSFKVLPEGKARVTQIPPVTQSKDVADSSPSNVDPSSIPMCENKKDDGIFKFLRSMMEAQGMGSWGDVLDAGAGASSLCFILRGDFDSITEVTATEDGMYGAKKLRKAVRGVDTVDIVVGNWKDSAFLVDEKYDVVVADYLLGAVEMFWPHGADGMIDRIVAATNPGGLILISGIEPYELTLDRSKDDDRLVLDIESIGESAAFLAGEGTYREVPESWVTRQVERHGFRVVASKQFTMTLSTTSLKSQISYAKDTLRKIQDPNLRKAYEERTKALEKEMLKWKKGKSHKNARNYAIVVQRPF